jgi:hypothetical protein
MMYAEGKLPKPDQVDGIGPLWKPTTIERGRARVVGHGVGGSDQGARARELSREL